MKNDFYQPWIFCRHVVAPAPFRRRWRSCWCRHCSILAMEPQPARPPAWLLADPPVPDTRGTKTSRDRPSVVPLDVQRTSRHVGARTPAGNQQARRGTGARRPPLLRAAGRRHHPLREPLRQLRPPRHRCRPGDMRSREPDRQRHDDPRNSCCGGRLPRRGHEQRTTPCRQGVLGSAGGRHLSLLDTLRQLQRGGVRPDPL